LGVEIIHTYDASGIYTVTLKVIDAEGYWDTDQVNITVYDYEKPVINIGGDIVINEGISYKFSSTGTYDNSGTVIWYNWTFGDSEFINGSGASAQNPSHTYDMPGIYIVNLTVSDPTGNINSSSITVTVRDTTIPFANAGPDDEVDERVNYEFNGTGSSDNSGEIVWYNWTFGDGDIEEGSNPRPIHKYNTPGKYTVILRVTDAWGLWDEDTMRLTVLDATDPNANAGIDDSVDAGESYQFDGSGSSDNVGIFRFYWDVDNSDGLNWDYPDLSGERPSHTFTEPGDYIVTLRVEDSQGNYDQDSVIITVNVVEVIDEIPPAKPTDLDVTLVATGSALELTWEAPVTNEDGTTLEDLDKYIIYYKKGATGDFKKLDEVEAGTTSYEHTGLANEQEYFYYIVAVDTSLNPSSQSVIVSGIPDVDTDGDGVGDFEDLDDDGDGYLDEEDAYPLDPERWAEDAEEGTPWLLLILIIVIISVVLVVLLMMKMRKKEEIPQAAPQAAKTLPPPPPGTTPQTGGARPLPPPPQPVTSQVQTRTSAVPPPPPPALAASATAPPPPPKGAAAPQQKIKCPKCSGIFAIGSTQRPIEIKCPHCGAKGMIK
jgi:PKD repeat protein/DNA-directed RNA polymerase subunit RPC12/RpoP